MADRAIHAIVARRAVWTSLAGVSVGAAVLRLPALGAPLQDYDEGVYWQSLRAMQAGHPLFSSVYSSQPPDFLLAVRPFYVLFGQSLIAARIGMLIFAVVTILAAYAIVAHLAGHGAGVIAALLVGLDPLLMHQSVTLQAEMPAVAVGLIAVLAASYARTTTRRLSWILAALSGAAVGAGCLIKLLDVSVAVPCALLLCWPASPGPGLCSAWRRLTASAIGGVVAVSALLAPFFSIMPVLLHQVVVLHVDARALSEGGWGAPLALALELELPLIALAVIGAIRGRGRVAATVGMAWAAASGVVVLLQHPLWPHHMAIIVPGLALAAAPEAMRWWSAATRRARTKTLTRLVRPVAPALPPLIVGAGLVAAAALGLRSAYLPAGNAAQVSQEVAALQSVTHPHEEIVTDAPDIAARADLDTAPELVDVSGVRLSSGDLTSSYVEGIITRDQITIVYFGAGRLNGVPGFVAWIEQHALGRLAIPGNGTVFTIRQI